MSDRLTLKSCSKADLLWVIEHVRRHSLSRIDPYIDCALSDLQLQKDRAKYDEADRLNKLAAEKRRQYIELLAPYDGVRLLDIPLPILEQADALKEEAQAADKKWLKIMGIRSFRKES